MESKRDSMGHLGTHLVSVGLNRDKMDSFWVAIFCSGLTGTQLVSIDLILSGNH